MKNIHCNIFVRLLTAMLVTVAVVVFSVLAVHAPAQNQSSLTLKSIRTDNTAVFYADKGQDCAWFVEMVLPTGEAKLVDKRPGCAWFVEMVFPTGDNDAMTDNLKSVAVTL
jgi:hypothetical protein